MSAQLVSVRPDDLLRLHEDVERKSNAIQRLWKERDELRKSNEELLAALKLALKAMESLEVSVGKLVSVEAQAFSVVQAAIDKAEK